MVHTSTDSHEDKGAANHEKTVLGIEIFKQDESLAQFATKEFNMTHHLQQKLQSMNLSTGSSNLDGGSSKSTDNIQTLLEGIRSIKKEIENEVTAGHSELISQVTGMHHIEHELVSVQREVNALQHSVQRLYNTIAVPYLNIQSRLNQLNNMAEATETLRHVNIFLRAYNKLKMASEPAAASPGSPVVVLPPPGSNASISRAPTTSITPQVDLAKASMVLYELEEILNSGRLRGIKAVDESESFIQQMGKEIRARAGQALVTGMKNLDQSEIAEALQVFFNLHCLPEMVMNYVQRLLNEMKQVLLRSLDPMQIYSKSTTPTSSPTTSPFAAGAKPGMISKGKNEGGSENGTTNSNAQFLLQLKNCLADVHSIYVQIWHMEHVISKKKDPHTHVYFDQVILKPGYPSILESFWNAMTRTVSEELNLAITKSQFIRNIFEVEYPEILRMMNEFVHKFEEYTPFLRQASEDNVFANSQIQEIKSTAKKPKEWIEETLRPIETLYLGKSWGRLVEKTNFVFSKVRKPSNSQDPQFQGLSLSEIRVFSSSLLTELHNAKSDERLLLEVAKNVNKVVLMFGNRVEDLIMTDGDSTSLDERNLARITSGEKFNGSLYNGLFKIYQNLQQSLPEGSTVAGILAPAMKVLYDRANDILSPIFKSIEFIMKRAVALIQTNLATAAAKGEDMGASAYVTQIDEKLKLIQRIHLSVYDPQTPIYNALTKQVAGILTKYYLYHVACLDGPLTEQRKLKLAGEMVQIEYSISSSLYPVDKLSSTLYKELKAFRKLLFVDQAKQLQEQASQQEDMLGTIEPVLLVHFLISRSGMKQIRPEKLRNQTIIDYVEWLFLAQMSTNSASKAQVREILSRSVEMLLSQADPASEESKVVVEICTKLLQ